jgi:hypothetical protein
MKYRIVPLGVSDWKVQTWVWWLPIWFNETRDIGPGVVEVAWFSTAAGAEAWIAEDIEWRTARRNVRRLSRERLRTTPPQEYFSDSHSSTNKSS